MRVHLMSEDALDCDDPTRVLLARAINDSHTAAADFFQNFVVTEAPLGIGHVVFYEDTLERFTRPLPFYFKSLAQETVDACAVVKSSCRAASWAFRQILVSFYGEIRSVGCFVHQAVAANAAHKWRISSSTSAGFATV